MPIGLERFEKLRDVEKKRNKCDWEKVVEEITEPMTIEKVREITGKYTSDGKPLSHYRTLVKMKVLAKEGKIIMKAKEGKFYVLKR